MKAWDHTSTQVLPCSKKKVLKVETCLYQSPSVTDAAIAPQKWSGRVLDDPSNIFRLKINDPQKCDGEIHFRNSSTTFLWHGPNVHGQVANRRYASPVYWLHWLNRTGCFLETRIEKTHGKKNPKPPPEECSITALRTHNITIGCFDYSSRDCPAARNQDRWEEPRDLNSDWDVIKASCMLWLQRTYHQIKRVTWISTSYTGLRSSILRWVGVAWPLTNANTTKRDVNGMCRPACWNRSSSPIDVIRFIRAWYSTSRFSNAHISTHHSCPVPPRHVQTSTVYTIV